MFKKLCVTVMGVGLVSSLMSAGTLATFTATTTNTGNSFAAGTLKISTTTGTGTATGSAPNIGTTSFTSGAACTNVVASACGTIVATSTVSTTGLMPGQFVTGQITVTNAGTLPAYYTVLAQNITDVAGTAATTTGCASDINNNTTLGVTACKALGQGLSIQITDSNGPQCVFGNGTNTGATANTAPNADSVAASGACGTITANAADITPAGGLAAVVRNKFNTGAGTFSTVAASPVYIQGTSANANGAKTVGSTSVKQWLPGESHTFTVTIILPDRGTNTSATLGTNTVTAGNDIEFMGGSVGFDLIFLATQS